MDEHGINPAEDEHFMESPETPEDVAVLYTWTNVHGGKYRDFSASRREYKAQQRHRIAEEQRQTELESARAREEAATRDLEEARRREAEVSHDEESRRVAEDARRRAEERADLERIEAQRHVETAETLKRAMEEAQLEMEEARRRVQEQEARYAEADARYRASGRSQIPGEIDDPYYFLQAIWNPVPLHPARAFEALYRSVSRLSAASRIRITSPGEVRKCLPRRSAIRMDCSLPVCVGVPRDRARPTQRMIHSGSRLCHHTLKLRKTPANASARMNRSASSIGRKQN